MSQLYKSGLNGTLSGRSGSVKQTANKCDGQCTDKAAHDHAVWRSRYCAMLRKIEAVSAQSYRRWNTLSSNKPVYIFTPMWCNG